MIDKDAFSMVSETLRPETFYEPRHQKIYNAIQTLSMNENPVDIMTVVDELKRELEYARLDNRAEYELYSLASVADYILTGAIARKESIGAHYIEPDEE